MLKAAIRFLCTHCLSSVTAAPENAGLTGRCPHCRGVMSIPSLPPKVDPSDRLATVDFDCLPDRVPQAAASCPGIS